MASTVTISGLEDYLSPAEECVIPINVAPPKTGTVRRRERSERAERRVPARTADNAAPAQAITIDLNDCLACSGCITSAETILVEKQGSNVFEKLLVDRSGAALVVSVSPQSTALLAAALKTNFATAYAALGRWLVMSGADAVISTARGQAAATAATVAEITAHPHDEIVVSSCPGVVAYLEKTHPNLVPRLSSVASPAVLTGRMVGDVLGAAGLAFASPDSPPAEPTRAYYHVSIQPCFDRKLEAVRKENAETLSLVVGTAELLQAVERRAGVVGVDAALDVLRSAPEPAAQHPLFVQLQSMMDRSPCAAPSGGYAAAVAMGLTGGSAVHALGRNTDQHVWTAPDGTPVAAAYYGFRNVQNMVRRARRGGAIAGGRVVELMACPHGCCHGGAQVPHGADTSPCDVAVGLMSEAAVAAGPGDDAGVATTVQLQEAAAERAVARAENEAKRTGFTTVELGDW